MSDNPRRALLDALIAERFSVYVRPEQSPVTKSVAALNALDLLHEIEDTDRYDRTLRLINSEEAS